MANGMFYPRPAAAGRGEGEGKVCRKQAKDQFRRVHASGYWRCQVSPLGWCPEISHFVLKNAPFESERDTQDYGVLILPCPYFIPATMEAEWKRIYNTGQFSIINPTDTH
jgi:hypothetical protein